MKVPYRQGLLQHQTNFLTKSGTTVYLNTTNKPTVFTVSYGNSEYLFTEPASQGTIAAWPDVPTLVDSWLYWDINKNTAERTFGITLVEPLVSSVNPFHPLDTIPVDQHWFDTTNKKMKVWDGSRWNEYIRIFATKVVLGSTLQPYLLASQVSLTMTYESGKVLFDGYGKPIKKADKTFLSTEDQWFIDGSNVQVNRLEVDISTALANESIPEFHIVKLVDFGRVALASYEDTSDTALAIATEAGTYDEIINISFQGLVTNPNWNWPEVNAALWVDAGGVLTTVDPHVVDALRPKQVPVARVVSETSIMFMQGLGGVGPLGPTGPQGVGADPATTTTLGTAKLTVDPTDPEFPIVVEDNDPRLVDARSPLPHTHPATAITTTSYGTLTNTNVQQNLHEMYDMKLSLSGGTMTGALYLNTNPTANMQAATKQYVDSIATGLHWIDPLCAVNMIGDDLTSPPPLPSFADMYIVPVGGLGAWSSLDGHLVRWTGTVWEDLGVWLTGPGSENRRFGVSVDSNTTGRGTFLGRDDQVAIWTASTQTWSFYDPSNSDAFYVCNEMSLYKFNQFVYDGVGNKWVRFGGPQALTPGNQLTLVGNVLNVVEGSGSGLDADTLDGLDSSDFALVGHNHDGLYVKIAGDTMTGTLVLNGPNAVIANTPSTFQDSVTMNSGLSVDVGNIAVATGTVQVSRDPLLPLEVATKQYVDLPKNLPYDMSFFIGGVQTSVDTKVGCFVSTRGISISETFAGSNAYAENEPSSNTKFIIRKNGNLIGYVNFDAGNKVGYFTIPGVPIGTNIQLFAGDRFDIWTDNTADNNLSDVAITVVGCSAANNCIM